MRLSKEIRWSRTFRVEWVDKDGLVVAVWTESRHMFVWMIVHVRDRTAVIQLVVHSHLITWNQSIAKLMLDNVDIWKKNAETRSSLIPQCVSSRILEELDLPAAPLSLTVAVDGQCLGLLYWAWQKSDIERPKAFHRWTGHPSTSSEWGESVIIINEILGGQSDF